jgi:hypothetical protein
MEDRIEALLSSCSEIDFGDVTLSEGEKDFYSDLNNEIILLCKSLPESTQTDALLFLMRYLGTSFDGGLSFFRRFYVPAWSVIYWLIQSGLDDKGLEQTDIKNAKTAHSMAMFLHALDDHLNDGEIPISHRTLLSRSQSWMIMTNALSSLADGVDGGKEIVRGFIDDYYSFIDCSEEIESLDRYCDIFRKQMATWFIVPVLMTKKMTTNEKLPSDIQTAYGSFGIAWRLLDDIRDIKTDMTKSAHSAIYICLPEDKRNFWDKVTGEELDKSNSYARIILNYILENGVLDRIKERICCELEFAVSIADDYNMTGLADEFRCLLRPLKNGQDKT